MRIDSATSHAPLHATQRRREPEAAPAAASAAAPAAAATDVPRQAPPVESSSRGAEHRNPVAALRQWINHPDRRDSLPLPDLSATVKGQGFQRAVEAYQASLPAPVVVETPPPVVVLDPPVVETPADAPVVDAPVVETPVVETVAEQVVDQLVSPEPEPETSL